MSPSPCAQFLESIATVVRVDGFRAEINDFPAARKILARSLFEDIFFGETSDCARAGEVVFAMCRRGGIGVLSIGDLYTAAADREVESVTSVVMECGVRPGSFARAIFEISLELELGALIFDVGGLDEEQARGAVLSVMAAAFCEAWPMPVMFRGEQLPFDLGSCPGVSSEHVDEIRLEPVGVGVDASTTDQEFRELCTAAWDETLSASEACETFELVRRYLIPIPHWRGCSVNET